MRDNSVTIAKGITIMLMVMGHSGCPSWMNDYLSMLRMPLFFFMSGYCFKINYLNDWKTFMRKRINGIYKPYLKWSLFFLLMHNIFFHLNIYNEEFGIFGHPFKLYSMYEILYRSYRIIIPMDLNEPLVGVFWFLKSLLWGSIIFYITKKGIKNIKLGILFLLIITLLFSYSHFFIPIITISARSFLAALFIMFGHFFKSEKIKIHTSYLHMTTYAIIVGIGAILTPSSMKNFNYANLIPYTICALAGTLMIFGISKRIVELNKNKLTKILVYIGDHTFEVLTWHLLAFKLSSLIIIFVYGMRIQHLAETMTIGTYANKGWWVVYTIIGIVIPIIWTYYYSKCKLKFKWNKFK